MGKHSEVKSLNETDTKNFSAVYTRIGTAALLPDDVADLYDLHYKAMSQHFPDFTAQIAGALYVNCRKHLVLGVVSLLRRYSSQAFRETRGALESAGIAHAIQVDPESFRILENDKGSGESRKAARNHFTSTRLFPANVPALAKLKKLYEKASELSHSNRRTFAPHLNVRDATFSYQDIRQEDIPRIVTNHLLWISAAHLKILYAADVVFANTNADFTKFKKERKDLGERLDRFADANEGRTVDS